MGGKKRRGRVFPLLKQLCDNFYRGNQGVIQITSLGTAITKHQFQRPNLGIPNFRIPGWQQNMSMSNIS